MDQETKGAFEKLAGMVADGFSGVNQRIDDTNQRIDDTNQRIDDTNQRIDETNHSIQELARELRSEIKSIRAELARIPDDIDATYSGTLNDLLERVTKIEKKLQLI